MIDHENPLSTFDICVLVIVFTVGAFVPFAVFWATVFALAWWLQ